MSRRETTKRLTDAATRHYVKKRYAVFPEFGVGHRGERRLDLLCMNFKCNFIGIETKSCRQDYTTDSKWRDYLPYTNKLYILIPRELFESSFFERIQADTKPWGVGIMTDSANGITVVQNAKSRPIEDKIVMKTLIKMAWRNGINRAKR